MLPELHESPGHSTQDAQTPSNVHDDACYECSGWPGPTDISDEWKRWALDFRPTFLPARGRAA